MGTTTTWVSIFVAVLCVLYVERELVLEEVRDTVLDPFLSPVLRALPGHPLQSEAIHAEWPRDVSTSQKRPRDATAATKQASQATSCGRCGENEEELAAFVDLTTESQSEGEPSVTITLRPNGASGGGRVVRLSPSSFPSLPFFLAVVSDLIDIPLAHAKGSMPAIRAVDDQGREITKYEDLREGSCVFLLPVNVDFQWPFIELGHVIQLDPELIDTPTEKPIELESLSDSPRVFLIRNFFSEAEADQLIADAMALTDEGYAFQDSKVMDDAGKQRMDLKRTSRNAFVENTEVAKRLRQRSFALLRKEYSRFAADGLQVLHYEQRQAYIGHHDYFFENVSPTWNWEPATGGSNRFATVFLYFSDVEAGGQTVFLEAEMPPNRTHQAKPDDWDEIFKDGTWEKTLSDQCYQKLAVYPKRLNAVLFYSQKPDSSMDTRSLHGGCPVVHGTKWAANLWVWNKVRFLHFPAHLTYQQVLERMETDDGTQSYYTQVTIQVHNRCPKAIEAVWEGQVILTVPSQKTLPLLSYETHEFLFRTRDRHRRKVGELRVSEANGYEQEITLCGDQPARVQTRRAQRV